LSFSTSVQRIGNELCGIWAGPAAWPILGSRSPYLPPEAAGTPVQTEVASHSECEVAMRFAKGLPANLEFLLSLLLAIRTTEGGNRGALPPRWLA
jgi:hypothetical protein